MTPVMKRFEQNMRVIRWWVILYLLAWDIIGCYLIIDYFSDLIWKPPFLFLRITALAISCAVLCLTHFFISAATCAVLTHHSTAYPDRP